MKTPRDINAKDLIKSLSNMGYEQSRQTGSHIRLSAKINSNLFYITIPNHNPIKIGTLSNIL